VVDHCAIAAAAAPRITMLVLARIVLCSDNFLRFALDILTTLSSFVWVFGIQGQYPLANVRRFRS
jgi:hypothetical protein